MDPSNSWNPLWFLEDSSSNSSSSSDDPCGETAAFLDLMFSYDVCDTASSSRNSIKRDARSDGHARLVRDYFADDTRFRVYFRERFRMEKRLFQKIVDDMENNYEFFQTKYDARFKINFLGLQKCTFALRQLAYGHVPDSLDEYLQMLARTSRKALQAFCKGIIHLYGKEYLRRPTRNDVQILYEHHAAYHGFPDMLGSVDCTHWAWRNCPMAWHAQFHRGDHPGPTIMLEAVASQDTWFWHAFFGVASSNNDLNVLNQSPLFNGQVNGTFPVIPYTIRGTEYKHGYYLTYGIYPRWAVFVKTIPYPTGDKRIRFSKTQEAARKDVERAFGVLKQRWGILRGPARQTKETRIRRIIYACIILHNMILKDEGLALCPDYIPDPPMNAQVNEDVLSEIRDNGIHETLRMDLIDHIGHAHIPRLDG